MKQQKISIWEGFFVGALFGEVVFWLLEEHQKSKTRIEFLEKNLNDGYQIDKFNLDRDWQNIYTK